MVFYFDSLYWNLDGSRKNITWRSCSQYKGNKLNWKTQKEEKKMGSSQTKEEVIIAQAGNSGGNTVGTGNGSLIKIAIEIAVMIICCIIMMVYCFGKCKKRLEKKIRAEITRSQEIV